MPIKDPVARAENHKRYMKEIWYPANRKKHQALVHKRKDVIYDYIRLVKSLLGCSKCFEKDPRCLDFHHLGNKSIGISKLSNQGWSWDRINQEIEKCVVLCSNCHRKEHGVRHTSREKYNRDKRWPVDSTESLKRGGCQQF